jgi:histidyl-tRNA synthetase
MDHGDRSLKAQMKRANRLKAAQVLIVGEAELAGGQAPLRDMATKSQVDLPLDQVVDKLKAELNRHS